MRAGNTGIGGMANGMCCSFQEVSKAFKGKKAVERVSFIIAEGETVAILHSNGAG